MRAKVLMGTTLAIAVTFGAILGAGLLRPEAASSAEVTAPQAAGPVIGYYTILGYEGIPTLGFPTFTAGPPPAVGDYVSTHCRYIDVQNTIVGHYYLRYPLHLPDGVTITDVAVYVADFNLTGNLWVYLRSRPWASRDNGNLEGFTVSDNDTANDKYIDMGTKSVPVDNETTEYWIDVSPQNDDQPGRLCVYGIRVTYTYNAAYLPMVSKGW